MYLFAAISFWSFQFCSKCRKCFLASDLFHVALSKYSGLIARKFVLAMPQGPIVLPFRQVQRFGGPDDGYAE